jgi:hypothetical protein
MLNSQGLTSGTVIVLPGTYTSTSFSVSQFVLEIRANQESQRPSLSLVSPQSGTVALGTVGPNANVTISSFNIIYNILNSNNIYLFITAATSSNLTITGCVFTMNVSDVIPVSLIQHNGGNVSIIGSSFTNFYILNFALITLTGFIFIFIFLNCVSEW